MIDKETLRTVQELKARLELSKIKTERTIGMTNDTLLNLHALKNELKDIEDLIKDWQSEKK